MSKGKWVAVVVATYLSLVAMLSAGCRNGKEADNYSTFAATLEGEPTVACQADPENPVSRLTTFTVEDSGGTDPLAKKQLGWLLRNNLEAWGYEYVEEPEDADFVVVLAVANEYREHYIPPSQVTVPRYVPSETIRATGRWSGSAWGTGGSTYGSGSSSTRVRVPGYWTTETYARPGGTRSRYYPAVALDIYQVSQHGRLHRVGQGPSRELTHIWRGSAVLCSTSSRFDLTGQMALMWALTNLANTAGAVAPLYDRQRTVDAMGSAGMILFLFMPDGQTTYPVVYGVKQGSAAERAGVRRWDIIAGVDGRDTANKSLPEVNGLIRGQPEDTRTLAVWRLKEQRVVKVILSQ